MISELLCIVQVNKDRAEKLRQAREAQADTIAMLQAEERKLSGDDMERRALSIHQPNKVRINITKDNNLDETTSPHQFVPWFSRIIIFTQINCHESYPRAVSCAS